MTPEQAKSQLRQLLEAGNVMLFAGAGVGRHAGLPSWGELLRELILKIPEAQEDLAHHKKQLERFIEKKEYLRAADYLKVQAGATLNEIAANYIDGYRTDLSKLRPIARLPFSKCMTTNWDSLLEGASLSYVGEGLDSHWNTDNGYERFGISKRTAILHLHGSIRDPKRLVFDSTSYQAFTDDERYSATLRLLFASHPFLFVGISFDDPPIRQFLEYCRKYIRFYVSHNSFALLANPSTELLKELENTNITPVCFDSYDDLWKFVSSLTFTDDEISTIRSKHVAALPELRTAKTQLATYYSAVQLRIRGDETEVQTKLISALVLQTLKPEKATSFDEINGAIASVLIMKRKRTRPMVEEALLLLKERSLVLEESKGTWRRLSTTENENTIDTRLENILDAILQAYDLTSSKPLPISRTRLKDFLLYSIDRKAAIIAGRDDAINATVSDLLNEFLQYSEMKHLEEIDKALRVGLITLSEKDASCLVELALAAYAFQVAFSNPEQIHGNSIRDVKEYFVDSSVLLPILAGISTDAAFNKHVLEDLTKAGKRLWITPGILEEIQSHLLRAQEEYKSLKENDDSFANSIYLHSDRQENVFQHAFALLRQEKNVRFNEYLAQNVEWGKSGNNVEKLKAKLAGLNISCLELKDPTGEKKRIETELRSYLTPDDKKIKMPHILEHDSELIFAAIQRGPTTGIVSHDNKLFRICQQSRHHAVSKRMAHPIQIINLLESGILPGIESRGYINSLLPTGRGSLEEIVQTHYLSRLLSGENELRKQDVKEILEKVMAALQDLASKKRDIEPKSNKYSTENAIMTLDYIDARFLQYLNKEKQDGDA